MTLLTRDQIISASDLPVEEVEVTAWGGAVRVQGMNGTCRDAFEESLYVGEGKDRRQDLSNIRAKLVAATLVDADGNRIFSDSDVSELGKKSAAALDFCFDVAQRLNGMTPAAKAELGNVSGSAPNADSTSA